MERIYKFALPLQEEVSLELPKDSKIIRVDVIDGLPFLWAICNTKNSAEVIHLEMYKTGQEFKSYSENLQYLGTCKLFIGQELCLYIFKKLK